jgi:long-chain acyl-CoA synthetase
MTSNTISQNKTGYASIDRPWRNSFSKEVLAAELPSQTMFEYIYEANKDRSDEIALEYMDMKKVTFGELWQHIEEAAKGLTALGVQPGEIVTIAMPNTPEFVYLAYAVNRVGAVMNLIHPLPGEKELHGYLDEAESRFFFMFDGTYNIIKDSLKETTVQKAIVISPAQSLSGIKRTLYKWAKFPKLDKSMCMTWTEFLKNGEDVAPAYFRKDPDTMAVISHTGGTTGEPKGCMLSDTNENAVAFQVRLSFPGAEEVPGKCVLVVLPPFVNYSFCNGIHEGFGMGMRLGLVPNYEIGKYHEYHKLHNVAVINSIPQYCQAMMNEKEMEGVDLSSLMYIAAGGEAMDRDIENQFNEFLAAHGANMKVSKGYGCTEFASVVSFTYPEVNFPNSVGVPLPMVNLKIVEPGTTDELKIGETG